MSVHYGITEMFKDKYHVALLYTNIYVSRYAIL